VGDTLKVSWEWDTSRTGGVAVWLSVNGGEDWTIITPASVPSHAAGSIIGTFAWPIQPTLGGLSTVSTMCKVRAWEYTLNELVDESDAMFSIGASTVGARPGARVQPHELAIARTGNGGLALTVGLPGSHEIAVHTLDGTSVVLRSAPGPSTHVLEPGRLPAGAYVVRVRAAGRTLERCLTVGSR